MRFRVVAEHHSTFPDPISFAAGQRVTVHHPSEEYPGWVWVETEAGACGWAPEAYVSRTGGDSAHAKVAYDARELNTEEGETLEGVIEESGWVLVKNAKGEYGWVPKEGLRAMDAPAS